MNTKKNIKKILAIGTIGLLALGGLTGCTQDKTPYSADDVKIAVNNALKSNDKSVEIANMQAEIMNLKELTAQDKLVIEDYKAELAKLEAEKELANAPIEVPVVIQKYELEDVTLNTAIDTEISDRYVKKMIDSEIKFNDDTYDVEEALYLDGLKVETNNADYNGNAYLTIPTGGIKYEYTIDNTLDTSEITDDERLEITFLGREMIISEWDVDSITYVIGEDYAFKTGESRVIDGKTITVRAIGEDAVYVLVDGVGKVIGKEETKTVNGVDIEAYEVLSTNNGDNLCTLRVGHTEVTQTIEDGDEYAKDSIWEYEITANSISLVLTEEYKNIDVDEEFKALKLGDKLSLPNDYLTVEYSGLIAENTEQYRFDLTTKESDEYVRVKGNFVKGIADYTMVYIDSSGIYDDDLVLIDATEIQLADTEQKIAINGTGIVVDNIMMPYALDDLFINGVSKDSFDEDYTTDYGIKIANPENGVEDKEFKLVIPEEQIEASVKVY